ncbi:MAG: putative transcriptional regulator [Enterobacterales bacterium]|jgi:predicted transcriptional regulator
MDTVKVTINGITVEGSIIQRTEADLKVSFIQNNQTKEIHRHIAYFALPYINFKSNYGLKRARELLVQLYLDGES